MACSPCSSSVGFAAPTGTRCSGGASVPCQHKRSRNAASRSARSSKNTSTLFLPLRSVNSSGVSAGMLRVKGVNSSTFSPFSHTAAPPQVVKRNGAGPSSSAQSSVYAQARICVGASHPPEMSRLMSSKGQYTANVWGDAPSPTRPPGARVRILSCRDFHERKIPFSATG